MKTPGKSLKILLFLSFLQGVLVMLLINSFANASNYYWVNGKGNWSDYTNHWAINSGGNTFHLTTPGVHDNVFFDSNSFTQPGDTVFSDLLMISCNTMNWTGVVNNPVFYRSYVNASGMQPNPFTYDLRIYGSLILSHQMIWSFTGKVGFVSNLTGNTIKSDGVTINTELDFDNPNGGWFLSDSLVTENIQVNFGNFNTNNQFVYCDLFQGGYNPVSYINLGVSEIRCKSFWSYYGDADKINANDAIISFDNGNNYASIESSDSVTYGQVIFYGNGFIYTSKKYNIKKLIFEKDANLYNPQRIADTLLFNNPGFKITNYGGNNIITGGIYTEVNGTCGNLVSIEEIEFKQGTGTAIFNYCDFKQVTFTGNAILLANNCPHFPGDSVLTFTNPAVTDLYWVGNSGNWKDAAHWSTTSGGPGGVGCLPSPFHTVHIDNNSFSIPAQTITVDSSERIYCYTLDWNNTQPNSTFLSEDSLSTFSIYKNFNIASAVNFNFRGSIYLNSDTIGNIIHTGNNFLNCMQLVITGDSVSTFILDDSLKVKGDILASLGELTAPGRFISCRILSCSNGVFSNSRIDVLKALNGHYIGNGIQVYIYENPLYNYPSIYGFSGNISRLECFSDMSCYNTINTDKIILHGNALFYKAFSADTIIFNSPGKKLTFTPDPAGAYQINYFAANGNCNQLISIEGTPTSTWTYPNNIQNALISYAFISNFPVTSSITVYNCKSWGGNTNITFAPLGASQDMYWIGGSGSWDDGNHWSFTSGGNPALCSPAHNDNVFFDANSFTAPGQTVNVSNSFYPGCNSMNWTGAAFSPSIEFAVTNFYMTGSLTLIPQMNWPSYSIITFDLTTAPQTITSAGHNLGILGFRTDATFGYSLTDPLTCGHIGFSNGKFNSNNQPIHAGYIAISSSNWQIVHANFGSSQITLDALYLSNNLGIPTTDLDSATIETNIADLKDTLVTIKSITFNSFSFNGYYGIGQSGHIQKMIIKGYADLKDNVGFTIDTLLVENPDYILSILDTLTVGYLAINGNANCERFCGLQPFNGLPDATLIVPTGIVAADYVELKGIHATGGAVFNADHCHNMGGNSGWNINGTAGDGKDLYWIGGQGSWTDQQHWSLSSGGPGAGCIPSKYDNVFFDANSISSPGDTVFMDQSGTYFNDMTCIGVQYNPTLYATTFLISVGGSLIVTPDVNLVVTRAMEFTANDSDNVIQLSGVSFKTDNNDDITFSGSGFWELLDSLSAPDNFLKFKNGSFRTNDFRIRAESFNITPDGNHKVQMDLGSSVIFSNYTCKDTSKVDLEASAAKFFSGTFLGGDHQDYYIVSPNTFGDSCHVHKLICNGPQISFIGLCNVDSLIFSGNISVCNFTTDTCLITGKWIINRDPVQPILIQSAYSTTIVKTADTLCFDNLYLKNVGIAGGVTAFAGYNSIDLGNNSGWIFGSCAMVVDSVWPGDANYDLIANNVDILNIGVAYGETGPVRTNPVITWTPQFATDWSLNFNSGFNYKHADCNGDGIVDNNDTTAVSLNYGQIHPFRPDGLPPQILTAPLLYLVPNVDTANLSQIIDIDVFLGNVTLPVDSIYGIAFTVNFNPGLIDTTSMTFDYTGSWLGTAGTDMLTFEKVYASSGYADLAMVRTDHADVSGYGFLARIGVVVIDNVAGRIVLPFTLSNVTAITYNQTWLDLNTVGDSVEIDTAAILAINKNPGKEIRIYPVPAMETLNVYSTGVKMEKIELCSLYGEVVFTTHPVSNKYTLSTSGIRNGIYLLKCYTPAGLVHRKIEIMHH